MARVLVFLVLLAVAASAVEVDTALQTNLEAGAEAGTEVQSVLHCSSTGDPHPRSFHGRRFDYYSENEVNFYTRGTEKINALSTLSQCCSRYSVHTGVAFQTGNDVFAVVVQMRPDSYRVRGKDVNLVIYRNNVKMTDAHVGKSYTAGDLALKWLTHRRVRITNVRTETFLDVDTMIYGRPMSGWGYQNIYVAGEANGASGLCHSAKVEVVGYPKSIFPAAVMGGRPKVYKNHLEKAAHVSLVKAAGGDNQLVNSAKKACDISTIVKKEQKDCVYDWLTSPPKLRPLVIDEYERFTVELKRDHCKPMVRGMIKGIKARWTFCDKMRQSADGGGRKCLGGIEKRFNKMATRVKAMCKEKCQDRVDASLGGTQQNWIACANKPGCKFQTALDYWKAETHKLRAKCGLRGRAIIPTQCQSNEKCKVKSYCAAQKTDCVEQKAVKCVNTFNGKCAAWKYKCLKHKTVCTNTQTKKVCKKTNKCYNLYNEWEELERIFTKMDKRCTIEGDEVDCAASHAQGEALHCKWQQYQCGIGNDCKKWNKCAGRVKIGGAAAEKHVTWSNGRTTKKRTRAQWRAKFKTRVLELEAKKSRTKKKCRATKSAQHLLGDPTNAACKELKSIRLHLGCVALRKTCFDGSKASCGVWMKDCKGKKLN